MRQPIVPGAQPMMQMGMAGMPNAPAQQQFIIPQQTTPLPTDHQNGKSNNVQLDPFGAF